MTSWSGVGPHARWDRRKPRGKVRPWLTIRRTETMITTSTNPVARQYNETAITFHQAAGHLILRRCVA
jgi:hypothetical protein